MKMITTRRIYNQQENKDNEIRILVDRLWPRGIRKEEANIHEWLKEIAPSTELRKWYQHDTTKFQQFKARYRDELDGKSEIIHRLLQLAKANNLVFIYSAKEELHNQAKVLKEYLEEFL